MKVTDIAFSFLLVLTGIQTTNAFAFEPIYAPPARMAHVTGRIEIDFQNACNIDVSAPVYVSKTAEEVSFKTPAYVRCQTSVNGKNLFISTALWINVQPSMDPLFKGQPTKYLNATTFVFEGSFDGEMIAVINGGSGIFNLAERNWMLYSDVVKNGLTYSETLIVDDNELKN